jgi:hypothetical protein
VRSRKALGGVYQWFIDWGLFVVVVSVALSTVYVIWTDASLTDLFDLWAVDSKTPPNSAVAWMITIIGWLAIPAIIGGFAGHVISQRITRSRGLPDHRMYRRSAVREIGKPPFLIDKIDNWHLGSPADQIVVHSFVRILHRNDWTKARDHWEIAIKDIMSTSAYDQHTRAQALTQARNNLRPWVVLLASYGRPCPVCRARS